MEERNKQNFVMVLTRLVRAVGSDLYEHIYIYASDIFMGSFFFLLRRPPPPPPPIYTPAIALQTRLEMGLKSSDTVGIYLFLIFLLYNYYFILISKIVTQTNDMGRHCE